jgi:hypothetical protein
LQYAWRPANRGNHSSRSRFAPRLQQPTRGFSIHVGLRQRKSERVHSHERRSMSRASSPLLFGLAPRGVFRALKIAIEAVGSYPTFSPLPNEGSIARRLAGFPARCHRAALRRRFVFCGTIRGLTFIAKPPGVTRRVALSRVLANTSFASPQDGVRTFLPPLRLASQQPAITRPARHRYYTLRTPCRTASWPCLIYKNLPAANSRGR